MNKDKLISRLHHLSKQKNVQYNLYLQFFYFNTCIYTLLTHTNFK